MDGCHFDRSLSMDRDGVVIALAPSPFVIGTQLVGGRNWDWEKQEREETNTGLLVGSSTQSILLRLANFEA